MTAQDVQQLAQAGSAHGVERHVGPLAVGQFGDRRAEAVYGGGVLGTTTFARFVLLDRAAREPAPARTDR
ncbi:hypothetical protein [Streptomyces sp. NPDC021212]|uniref:hypothetical protein n=1 Tax=Streptomyces sp. NPDC021212 TaxID=3365118 RepID=UPI0037999FCF